MKAVLAVIHTATVVCSGYSDVGQRQRHTAVIHLSFSADVILICCACLWSRDVWFIYEALRIVYYYYWYY